MLLLIKDDIPFKRKEIDVICFLRFFLEYFGLCTKNKIFVEHLEYLDFSFESIRSAMFKFVFEWWELRASIFHLIQAEKWSKIKKFFSLDDDDDDLNDFQSDWIVLLVWLSLEGIHVC